MAAADEDGAPAGGVPGMGSPGCARLEVCESVCGGGRCFQGSEAGSLGALTSPSVLTWMQSARLAGDTAFLIRAPEPPQTPLLGRCRLIVVVLGGVRARVGRAQS